MEKQKRLEKVYKRIDKHEILERINIKEEKELVKRMETEIFDETRALGEMKSKLRKVKTTILKKKRIWNETDEQKTLERQKIKVKIEKLKKVNKII